MQFLGELFDPALKFSCVPAEYRAHNVLAVVLEQARHVGQWDVQGSEQGALWCVGLRSPTKTHGLPEGRVKTRADAME